MERCIYSEIPDKKASNPIMKSGNLNHPPYPHRFGNL